MANNIICLFSLHERYLNNLLSRFDEGLIEDFYRWVMLFHDDYMTIAVKTVCSVIMRSISYRQYFNVEMCQYKMERKIRKKERKEKNDKNILIRQLRGRMVYILVIFVKV